MKNVFLSFLSGGIFFSIIIFSTASQTYQVHTTEEPTEVTSLNNRYYELRTQLLKMEVDFAKFYKKPKQRRGNKLRLELDQLIYITEDIQKEIFQLQENKKSLLGTIK